MRGYVDIVNVERIAGWAQNLDYPEAPVCLDIYIGDRLIGQALANTYREDLKRAGIGSGRHGFLFTLPPGMNIGIKSVEARRSFDGAVLQFAMRSAADDVFRGAAA